MEKDQVYAQNIQEIPPFTFNQEVADVFDDMLLRSIPFYQQSHDLLINILTKRYQENSLIYDLGCSTGTTLQLVLRALQNKNPRAIGIDESGAMLEKAGQKFSSEQRKRIQLCLADIEEIELQPAGVIIMNYTLQFLPRHALKPLLKKIHDALIPGGIFFLSEKLSHPHRDMEELKTDLYYDFKRKNGYSELEISQKREALENVLFPLTDKEHLDNLADSGFTQYDQIFKWVNFSCFLGIKD